MCIDTASKYVLQMVSILSRGNGDQINSLAEVSALIGMSPRSTRRVMNCERKDIPSGLYGGIRAAYLSVCAKQASKLVDAIRVDIAKYGEVDDLLHLLDEAEALALKVKSQNKGIST